jgi:formyltetrahydrofolate deformylase
VGTTILKLSCRDHTGLLALLSGWIAERGGNLLEVHQFTDLQAGWFFTRMAIETETISDDLSALRKAFVPIANKLSADWTIRAAEDRPKVVIMVSKLSHCLADLLWRWRSGELTFDVACVISNHEQTRAMVEREGIEFRHITFSNADKPAAFGEIDAILCKMQPDLVILARFMQILPPGICTRFHGKIINIHHSFLPSFSGANPYQKAHECGVKLIGATCHYATAELDAGPIIDQEVIRVEHFHTLQDLMRLGRDCERLVLARSVRWHLADRVLMHGKKSIVFRD